MTPREREPLAPHCTMKVGGPARFFVEAESEEAVCEAWRWAGRRGLAFRVLGGGSNLVVADEGVDGLVVKMALRRITARFDGDAIELTAAAGEPWDDVVRHAVEQGWTGIECLSGIPGLVGATPIQNVGAYGQEVSDTITELRALDVRDGSVVSLPAAACGFAYRTSRLKRESTYVVLSVTYRLAPGRPPAIRYAELRAHLDARGIREPSLADVRASVLAIRRGKSMLLDPSDPNGRSCGSFFLNPIVTEADLARLRERAGDPAMPAWPQPDGRTKLSAAWLIERAGFARGMRAGSVGLSSRHSLAIVCHEGARASDVLALARCIRDGVLDRFGIRLEPEPVFWGVSADFWERSSGGI